MNSRSIFLKVIAEKMKREKKDVSDFFNWAIVLYLTSPFVHMVAGLGTD